MEPDHQVLACLPLFRELDPGLLRELASSVEKVHLRSGDTLMAQGQLADAMYILLHGRLRAFVRREDGQEEAVGDIAAGEIVGEMALLSAEPRAATVRALRDSSLLRLSTAGFEKFVLEHPTALLHVTRVIVSRLQRTTQRTLSSTSPKGFALFPAGTSNLPDGFDQRLVRALAKHGETRLLTREAVDAAVGRGAALAAPGTHLDSEVIAWLHETEQTHRFSVYEADGTPDPWMQRCLRQADEILLVAGADSDPGLNAVERAILQTGDEPLHRDRTLILVHNDGVQRPVDSLRWFTGRPLRRHLHVRKAHWPDYERVARFLAGRAVGLVFSGGGARGFAHVGVLRAIQERELPIDAVAGTSFGASTAAACALGWDYNTSLERGLWLAVKNGSLLDYTLPAVALTRGARLTRRLQGIYGDARIEDLWYGFFCVSTNMASGKPYVHSCGPVWQAVRASAALPGIFPPVRSPEGSVLFDGSLVNNLPVDLMQEFLGGGRIIAVDLWAPSRFQADDLPMDGIVSGWPMWRRRLSPFHKRLRIPWLIQLLAGTSMVASSASRGSLKAQADLVLTPSLDGIGLLRFDRYQEAIDAGYQHAMERLAEWKQDL